jgi:hypothetical protein
MRELYFFEKNFWLIISKMVLARISIFEQFAEAGRKKVQQSLTPAREECNKCDMTAALSI